MSGRRVALLFIYAFGSMSLPVAIFLLLNKILNQSITNWIIRHLPFTILLIFVYTGSQLYIWFKMGSWASAIKPVTSERAPVQVLKKRLLSLNDDRIPFSIEQDQSKEDVLSASWKISDEKWIEVFSRNALKIQYKLDLKIIENRGLVLARDNFQKIEYTYGVTGTGVNFSLQRSFFKGISFFQYEKGAKYGIIFKDGELKVDFAYNYSYSISEIKNPVIEIIIGSGWEFRPIVFL